MRRAYLGAEGGKIVLIMSGGSGQFVEWPELIAKQSLPGHTSGHIHIIIVAGNNRQYEERYTVLFIQLGGRRG